MEMVGMIWLTGPQYGREPSAARAPHRLHEQCLLGTRLMPDHNAPPIASRIAETSIAMPLPCGLTFAPKPGRRRGNSNQGRYRARRPSLPAWPRRGEPRGLAETQRRRGRKSSRAMDAPGDQAWLRREGRSTSFGLARRCYNRWAKRPARRRLQPRHGSLSVPRGTLQRRPEAGLRVRQETKEEKAPREQRRGLGGFCGMSSGGRTGGRGG